MAFYTLLGFEHFSEGEIHTYLVILTLKFVFGNLKQVFIELHANYLLFPIQIIVVQ